MDLAECVVAVEPVVAAWGDDGGLELAEFDPAADRGGIDGDQRGELPSRDIHVWGGHAKGRYTTNRALQDVRAVFFTRGWILRDLRDYATMVSMSTTGLAPNWVPDASTFGARLALVRWRMGWNIREAERECNISQNLWGGWEAGKEPRNFIEIVNRIVLRTQVDRVWLMTGEGSPAPGPRPVTDVFRDGTVAITERPVVDLFTREAVA